MAINFPASPTTNQTYTFNGRTWTWNGVGWQATGSTGLTVYTKTDFTATAGQTSFSATYTVGFVDVYYNGSKLSTSEYTATTGSTVVLGTAAALGDIVETIAWTISSSFNPSLGSASATSLALGGATIGTNALAVTGTTDISSTINFGGLAAEGTVVAAATTNLGTSTANRQSVTGSTTITSFATAANSYRVLRFTGAPLLTYNATTLITPTKANIQAAPGDIATLTSDGSGNWTIIDYLPCGGTFFTSASGLSGTGPSNIGSLILTPGKWSLSAMYFYSGSAATIATVGIGTTSSSLAGMVIGTSRQGGVIYAVGGFGGATLGPFIVTLTATTTYYAVYTNDGSANSDNGSFTAQRII